MYSPLRQRGLRCCLGLCGPALTANPAAPFLGAASGGLRRKLHASQACWQSSAESQARVQTQAHSSQQTRPPLVYPEPSSAKHNDLASFLRYAERFGLDPGSTTYVGTRYEYAAAASLAGLGFALQRVGGASDHGIDLLGTWTVPSSPEPVRVLLQCKALAQRIGPHLVRELEGAFVGAPAGWRGAGIVGLLVAERPATKGIREAIGRSRWPMGFVCCSREGRVQQMLWNQRAEEEGLLGLGVGTRYTEAGPDRAELVLTWKGRHVTPDQPTVLPGEEPEKR